MYAFSGNMYAFYDIVYGFLIDMVEITLTLLAFSEKIWVPVLRSYEFNVLDVLYMCVCSHGNRNWNIFIKLSCIFMTIFDPMILKLFKTLGCHRIF